MDILIIFEHSNGKIHRMSWEAVAAGQSLAKDLGLTTAILILGSNVNELVEEASKKDVDEVLAVDHPLLEKYSSDGYSVAIKQIITDESPTYVIMGHTYMVRDFLPRVSVALKKPLLCDLTGYYMENGNPVFMRQLFQGKITSDILPNGEPPYLLTFQSAAFQEDAVVEGSGVSVRNVDVDLDESMIQSQYEEPFQGEVGGVDLTAAELIVTIGRGIGKEENINMVKELGDTLGAQLGASRPVVDAEWLPTAHQVGSSGQTVSPKLYLALGISGAIQHVVGMKGSKNIVAINKDPDAPIFELADYGIVGDIIEIVPKLTEAIKDAKA